MQKLIIFGTGKIAQIIYHYVKEAYDVCAFTVDSEFVENDDLVGVPVVPFEQICKSHPPADYRMLIAVGYHGMNKLRAQKYHEAKDRGYRFISYVDDRVKRFDEVVIGENSVVLDNTTIQPFVEIGNNTIVWSNVTVAHGSTVGDHCWIASGAVLAGDAVVQANSFVGINASIGHSVNIGSSNYIGANAQVSKNTSPDSVYIAEQAVKFRLNSDQFMRFAQM